MALDYQQSSELMNDIPFRGRIKVACLKYATYILNEAITTPGHNSRLKWAQQTGQMPDQTALTIQPLVVMDGKVQTEGAGVDDVELQSAVEIVVNKLI